MQPATDFDDFSTDYRERLDQCVRLSGQDADYFASVKAEALFAEFRARGIAPGEATVIDFGCGTGTNAVHLDGMVARYVGTDVAGAALMTARQNSADSVNGHFVHTSETTLPIRSGIADAILVSCVLHHIRPVERDAVVADLRRLLRPNGFVFVVEHNPYNPVTRWIVNRCEFDHDAVLLSAGTASILLGDGGLVDQRRRHILFVPGKGRIAATVNRALRRIPLGAQYTIAAAPASRQ